jgi:hypothetical protein
MVYAPAFVFGKVPGSDLVPEDNSSIERFFVVVLIFLVP